MKDKRRSLTSDEQVRAMKDKYGGRAAARRENPLDVTEAPKLKVPRVSYYIKESITLCVVN